MPEPRSAVANMRAYTPPTSGRLGKLRLDFNENVAGSSPKVSEFLRQAIGPELLATYPNYVSVREQLAEFFGVSGGELLLTNGTDEAIQLLINTFVEPHDEVIVLTPSYAMYRFYAELADARVVEVPWREADFGFDLDCVLSAVTAQTKAILLSNPNNPTGSTISQSDLRAVLQAAPQACVLVDEAYYEFYGETMIGFIRDFQNLFVCRTFSKAYGMAAMRVGSLMTCERNAAHLAKAQSPYSVNMLAAMAAIAAIGDPAYTQRYVAETLAGRKLIEDAFMSLSVRHWPSAGNFVLFDAKEHADECLARCRAADILIRDRRHELAGALRVTAGPPERIMAFINILREMYEK